MKTYASKSGAKKGAIRQNLTGEIGYYQTEDGRWYAADKFDQAIMVQYGTDTCPHCDCNLDNGVGQHLQDVNGTPIKHEKFEYECLACGEEFGPEIASPVSGLKIEQNRPTQNGKTRPSVGGKCRAVWDMCDKIFDESGYIPTPKVIKAAMLKSNPEVNQDNTCVIQLYRWRQFNGINGRVGKQA